MHGEGNMDHYIASAICNGRKKSEEWRKMCHWTPYRQLKLHFTQGSRNSRYRRMQGQEEPKSSRDVDVFS